MIIFDWYAVTFEALQNLWTGFINFVPELIGAFVIFIIGWIVAVGVGRLVTDVLKRLRFNDVFKQGDWKKALDRAELKIDPASFIGNIFKWVLVIVFLSVAVEILGLTQFASFINGVLGYLPNVLAASLIFVVAAIIADIAEKLLRAAVEGAQVGYGKMVGAIAKWAIWVFAIIAILEQLQIADTLVQTLYTGIIALLVVAGGIAFGLGGKDAAAEIVKDIRGKMQK